MDTSTRATGYDLFKLIVALLLLMLFLLLWRRGSQPLSAAPLTPSVTRDANPIGIVETHMAPSHTSTPRPSPRPTETFETTSTIQPSPTTTSQGASTPMTMTSPTATAVVNATAMIQPSPSAAIQSASTPTSPPSPSATMTVEEMPTIKPSATVTSQNVSTPTPLLSPTGTATAKASPTPAEATPSVGTACEAATERSRLQIGRNATILRRLNFRSSPGIQHNWLRTNVPGTQVEVVAGPECLPHLWGAYMWWQIRLPNGEIGWSAEASIHGTFYFMEPE